MLIQVADRSLYRPRLYMPGYRIPSLDDWARQCEREMLEGRLSPVVRAARSAKMADGLFYLDTIGPMESADVGSVTLATTDKALYTAAAFPAVGASYFKYVGKAILVRMFGRITTGATPGNGTWDWYWGTGADANGTIIQSSAALALTASQTNLSWCVEAEAECRAIGATGNLFLTGCAHFNVAVLASTLQPWMIPASAAATSGNIDLTAASIVSAQFKRSGSTAETVQVHKLRVIALN